MFREVAVCLLRPTINLMVSWLQWLTDLIVISTITVVVITVMIIVVIVIMIFATVIISLSACTCNDDILSSLMSYHSICYCHYHCYCDWDSCQFRSHLFVLQNRMFFLYLHEYSAAKLFQKITSTHLYVHSYMSTLIYSFIFTHTFPLLQYHRS